MMSTTVEVLRKARELYAANPSHCASEEYPKAGTCCPMTAVYAISGAGTRTSAGVLNALRNGAGTLAIPEWNARSSTQTVLAAFDRAIEAEES